MSEHDTTETYLDDDQEGQADLEHWREAVGRRAEAEYRRVARQRRRLVLISGGVVLAVLLGVIGWQIVSAARAKAPDEVALGGQRASVLFQLRAPDGGAAASVVIMHDRESGSGGMLAIPRDLVLDVPGAGVVPFGDALILAGDTLTRDALADLLGATIHGSFTFDQDTLVVVIDRLGGIEMAIDHPVVIDGKTVAEPARDDGVVRLRGVAALAYATDPVPGDTTTAAAERYAAVVRAVLLRIPSQFEAAGNLLNALGVVGSGAIPPDQLAAILAGAASDIRAETMLAGTVPVSPGGNGALDAEAAGPIVHSVLGSTVKPLSTGGTPRVLVQLGVAEDSAREAIKADILNAGYRFIDGGTLPGVAGSPVATTTITAFGRNGPDAARSLAIALGFDPKVVKLGQGEGVADVLVILGSDFEYTLPPAATAGSE